MGQGSKVAVACLTVALLITCAFAIHLQSSLDSLRSKYDVLSAEYDILEDDYGKLHSKYSTLLSKYEELKRMYSSLDSNYTILNLTYSKLRSEYAELIHNYTSLKEEYTQLSLRHAELEANYTALKKGYGELEEKYAKLAQAYSTLTNNYTALMKEYRSLKSEYGDLQQKYVALNTKYSTLRTEHDHLLSNLRKLMEETRKRGGRDPSTFPEFIDWKSSEVMNTVKSINFNAYGDPYKAIYEWIENHITYNHDTPEVIITSLNASFMWWSDYWQYASETLKNRYGDCEDQAILAAAMVEAYWNVTYGKTYLIYVALVDVKGTGVEGGHALLIVPFQGGEIAIIDPAAHTYVPPMKTLNALQEYEERARWKITYVYGVFDLDEYYRVDASTLEEFAQWLDTH